MCTYNAHWLALLALNRLVNAELELATLSPAEVRHEAPTPAELHRKSELYNLWAIAMLELVLLYRLHLELEARPPELRRDWDWRGKLFGVGERARQDGPDLLLKMFGRLDAHPSGRSSVPQNTFDPLVEGTFSDCAGVLDHFLKTMCKIDAAHDQAVHENWLASIRSLAEEVLQFLAAQVLFSLPV